MISYACGYQEEEYLDPDQRDQEENAIKHCAPHEQQGSLYFPESCVYKYQSICDSEATGITGEIP